VVTWSVLWRHGVGTSGYCYYVSRHVHHYLREWFLSFGVVAMRPFIPGSVTSMACSSLGFD
jgi:hypothetical protein